MHLSQKKKCNTVISIDYKIQFHNQHRLEKANANGVQPRIQEA